VAYRGWLQASENVINIIELHNSTNIKSLRYIVNAAMRGGATPLMLAVDSKNSELCDFLISKGADVLAEDKVRS
jgi:ankyrin repeat protein